MLGEVRGPRKVEESLIRACDSLLDGRHPFGTVRKDCRVSDIFLPTKPTNSHKQSRKGVAAYAYYEAQKRAWIASHPDASPRDYEAAMTRLARECNV
jgi:hypothetical protein